MHRAALTAAVSNVTSIAVTWDSPASIGSSITSYTLWMNEDDPNGTPTYVGSLRYFQATGLLENSSHTFRVAASNSEGQGPRSDASILRTVPGSVPVTPDAPLLAVHPGDTDSLYSNTTSIKIQWAAPYDMGLPVLSYKVRVSGGLLLKTVSYGSGTRSALLPRSDCTVAHTPSSDCFSPDTVYSFQVQAVNAEGESEWSLPLSATTQESRVPNQVTSVSLGSSTSSALLVVWSAPASFGSPILSYEVQKDEGAVASEIVTATSLLDSGLSPTQARDYRVRAQNAYGWGSWSSGVQYTTEAAAPTLASRPVLIQRGRTTMGWNWNAAIGNGHAVEGYDVELAAQSAPSTWSAAELGVQLEWSASGLLPYTSYRIRVRANSSGFPDAGAWSYSAYWYTRDYPAAPDAPTRRADTGGFSNVTSLVLEWPVTNGYGLTILEYEISVTPAASGVETVTSTGTATYAIVSDLSAGSVYVAKVRDSQGDATRLAPSFPFKTNSSSTHSINPTPFHRTPPTPPHSDPATTQTHPTTQPHTTTTLHRTPEPTLTPRPLPPTP